MTKIFQKVNYKLKGKITFYPCFCKHCGILLCCVFWPANACLRMHSHGRKRWKTFKNDEKVPFPSCAREAHVRHMKKNEEKRYFFYRLLVKIHNTQWVLKNFGSFFLLFGQHKKSKFKVERWKIALILIILSQKLGLIKESDRFFKKWKKLSNLNAASALNRS